MNSPLPILFKPKYSFQGQEENEQIIFVIRRHPFFIILKTLFLSLLALVPVAALIQFWHVLEAAQFVVPACAGLGLWLLLLWQAAFYALTMYTLDVWILTNTRIVQSQQNGFFHRTVSELRLSRVQDLSVTTRGIIQTFFHFGDLQVQTAGNEELFNFWQIPSPEKIKDEIMRLTAGRYDPIPH